VLSPGDEKRLAAVCTGAQQSAAAAGRPVLASFAFAHGAVDLLPFAESTAQEPFRVYWEHPADAFSLVAGGVAQRFSARGAGRFREMAKRVEPLLRSAATGGGPGAGPYAVGGFSFFDELDDTEWRGFGAAQMVVPAWMMVRRDNMVTAMVNRMVGPGKKPQSLLTEMLELVRGLARLPDGNQWDNGRAPLAGLQRLLKHLQGGEGHKQWREMVSRALADIRAGRLSKVVLARTFDVLYDKLRSPLPILKRLRKAYPDCFSFLFNPGKGQVFLGATPERLARFDDREVHLGALAGTMPRGATPTEDEALARRMLDSCKERSEHQIVVDAIVESIQGLGEIECSGEPDVVKLSNLQHLYTPITLRSEGPLSAISMIERLHPTPAVGGHPSSVALDRIRRFENFERGWYAGPVGWVNAGGEGEFAVALRSCTLSADRARLFAGGGIVADSDPEQEFLETQLKLKPILAAIADE
jgi:isochorismate synthase